MRFFRNCDYITLHVPATNDTRGMINAEAFGLMKDGVVIINCARDVLVDEPALAAALESGKLRKYVTDFATPEIVHLPGVIVSRIWVLPPKRPRKTVRSWPWIRCATISRTATLPMR